MLHEAEADGVLAGESRQPAFVGRSDLHRGDIAEAHEIASGVLQDDLPERLGRAQVSLGKHRELSVTALDASRRDLDVLLTDGVFHVRRCQLIRGEARTIEPDAHGITALPENLYLGHARDHLQPILHDAIGVVGELHIVVAIGVDGVVHDGPRVGFHLLHHRIFHFSWQKAPRPSDAIAHVVGRSVGIAAGLEAHGDLTLLGSIDRAHVVDTFDARDRVLQLPGDLGLDDLRVRPGVDGGYGDHWLVDVWQLANGQAVVRDHPEQNDDEVRHRGKHRPANTDIRDDQPSAPAAVELFGGTDSTCTPSRSLNCPAVTTTSPRASPERTSTMAFSRFPSSTSVSSARPSTTR